MGKPYNSLFFLVLFSTFPLFGMNEMDLVVIEKKLEKSIKSTASTWKIEMEGAQTSLLFSVSGESSNNWPGVTIPIPPETSDATSFSRFEAEVENLEDFAVTFGWKVSSPNVGNQKREVERRVVLPAKSRETISLVPVRALENAETDRYLFHILALPPWAGKIGGKSIDLGHLSSMLFYVPRVTPEARIRIYSVKAVWPVTRAVPFPVMPFVDTFGQYLHDVWPAKVSSIEEMKASWPKELNELKKMGDPSERNRFGGWARGPKREATGSFRTEKIDGRWSFVDPEGRLFFMFGMHGIRPGTATAIEGRERWFKDFPGSDPDYGDCFESREPRVTDYPPYKGKSIKMFNFYMANLIRKFGKTWSQDYLEAAFLRLKGWGFNAISANGDAECYGTKSLPSYLYTDATKGAPVMSTASGIWGKFYDVFDPGFESCLRSNFHNDPRVIKSLGNEYVIGYGIDNELSWGYDDVSISINTMACGKNQPAKKAMVKWLNDRHGGKIESLNKVWGASFSNWEEVALFTGSVDRRKAAGDLNDFLLETARKYFKTSRAIVKEKFPNKLYLGCRFSHAYSAPVVKAAAEFCDVVTFNVYEKNVKYIHLPPDFDKPILITEFHFTSPDRGYFSPSGLVEAKDQAARADMFKTYVESALRHPFIVGCAWFMYADEGITGHANNGENYSTGFVSISDEPYPEMTKAARKIGDQLYSLRFPIK